MFESRRDGSKYTTCVETTSEHLRETGKQEGPNQIWEALGNDHSKHDDGQNDSRHGDLYWRSDQAPACSDQAGTSTLRAS